MARRWLQYLWWLLPLASLIALAAWLRPATGFMADWQAVLVGAILIGVLVNYPIPVGGGEVSVAHTVGLMLGLADGPGLMGLSLAVGLTAGELVRGVWRRAPAPRLGTPGERTRSSLLGWSTQSLSLFGALNAYQMLGGRWVSETHALPELLPAAGASLAFLALFVALNWVTHIPLTTPAPAPRGLAIFTLVTLVPLPFAIVGAAAYSQIGVIALIVLGGGPGIVAPILRGLLVAERDRARRLQEVAMLGQVSRAIKESLDLNSLLTSIYQHVAGLLGCDTFYIALVEPEMDRLTYPISIRNGLRLDWAPRTRGGTLTDQVIGSLRARLVNPDEIRGLPSSAFSDLGKPPTAWIGAPLVGGGATLGCIALYHTSSEASFENGHLETLSILAGQVGVAIDHALLFEQTHSRAEALASLASITASMSSTLDPETTLELVIQSLIRVGGGEKAAIFLLDDRERRLWLARSLNLSDEFVRNSATIALDQLDRLLAFHARQPVLISDLADARHQKVLAELLTREGVRAYADFPLITPEGIIGQVSVYFTRPQRFPPSQVELLRTFTAQAAMAVANSRAHAATDKALQKRVEQLSALEAVGREMTSTLEPTVLPGTILRHALRITGAHLGHLAVSEPGRDGFRIVAEVGYPPGSPATQPDRIYPIGWGISGQTLLTARCSNIENLQPKPGQTDWSGGRSRSILSVPVLRQGKPMGVLTLESEESGAFTEDDEHLVTQLAAQAAVALTNAALYQEVEARLREQSLLYQASAQIAGTLETEGVALAAADSVCVALSADAAILSRLDGPSGVLTTQAAVEAGRPAHGAAWTRPLALGETPSLQSSLERGEPAQFTSESPPTSLDGRFLSEHRSACALLAVPIVLGTESIGVLEVLSKTPRAFDENEIRTARTIASQAAVGLQNATLFRRISESHDRLIAVLNSTMEGMLMADTSGRVLLANPLLGKLVGVSPERLVGRSLLDPNLQASRALGYRAGELENLISGLRTGDVSPVAPSTFESDHPARRMLERAETPVRDASGTVIGWLIVLRDVSEEMKLEEMRRQLTEMIVHDLRSPLTAILSSLKLLEPPASTPSSPVVSQALSVSRKSCQKMLGLVNSLLDIARLERGEMDLALAPLDVRGLCEELAGQYTLEANELGVILRWECCETLPTITVDPEKISRVLANLLDNALKFTPAGGSIDLLASLEDDSVLITIHDTGPGIPQDYREAIFERFTQVPGIAGRRRGTGLGLAFAKLAVEAHGGRIWLEDGLEGGSCFRLRLPLIAARQPLPG